GARAGGPRERGAGPPRRAQSAPDRAIEPFRPGPSIAVLRTITGDEHRDGEAAGTRRQAQGAGQGHVAVAEADLEVRSRAGACMGREGQGDGHPHGPGEPTSADWNHSRSAVIRSTRASRSFESFALRAHWTNATSAGASAPFASSATTVSSRRTFSRAAIATAHMSRSGSRVVRRWNWSPGHTSARTSGRSAYLPERRMNSNATPA